MGRIGVGGLAAGTGAFAGLALTRGIGSATGNDSMANATMGSIFQTAQKLVFNITYTFTRVSQIVLDGWARAVNAFGNGVQSMLNAMAGFVRGLAAVLPAGLGGETLTRGAAGLERMATNTGGGQALAIAGRYRESSNAMLRRFASAIDPSAFTEATTAQPGPGGADLGAGAGGYGAEQVAAMVQWSNAVKQIERDAAEQRLATTKQYEQQRTQTIAQYERSIAREAEDFARQRQRQAEQLNRQIADIRADAAKREARALAALNASIADARADNNERLAELERNYQRDRERSQRAHRDRLLSAAARLDAVAVREEQRRFALQEQNAAESYEERVAKEKASINERIEAAQEGHRRQLEQAREADEQRIQDLIAAQAEQQRIEDEDRAIRLQRQAEDHARQLEQMATAQAERMAQIDRQAAQERQALDEQFQLQLQSLGIYNEQWLKIQQAKEKASLAMFDRWWDGINKRFAVQGPAPRPIGPQPQPGFLTDFAGGRAAPAGQFPSSFNQLLSGVQASRAVTIAEGAITVNAAAGQDEAEVARLVRDEMTALLEDLN